MLFKCFQRSTFPQENQSSCFTLSFVTSLCPERSSKSWEIPGKYLSQVRWKIREVRRGYEHFRSPLISMACARTLGSIANEAFVRTQDNGRIKRTRFVSPVPSRQSKLSLQISRQLSDQSRLLTMRDYFWRAPWLQPIATPPVRRRASVRNETTEISLFKSSQGCL